MVKELTYDVVVLGTGTAGMTAAISAHENGAKVGVLEKASREERGGNSYFTGGMLFAYESAEDLLPLLDDPTPADLQGMADALPHRTQAELWDQLMAVNQGESDQDLLQTHVSESYNTVRWVRSHGQSFLPQPIVELCGAGGNPVRMNGGTQALMERYYAMLERGGTEFHYETPAIELIRNDRGAVVGVKAWGPEGDVKVNARAVILACGGFQANPEMRARYFGRPWETVKIRGVPFDTGDGLRMALELGAMPKGGWTNGHATPADLSDMTMMPFSLPSMYRSGKMGPRDLNSYGFGIMVNIHGQRFVDEAWDVRSHTYANMGQYIIQQPLRVAFQVFDAKARRMDLLRGYERSTPAKANTPGELAEKLGVDPQGLVQTLREFNAAVQPGDYRPSPFWGDGKHTAGLAINKSNFAIAIDEPPFEGYTACCGFTHTWGGLSVNPQTAQVMHVAGRPIPGLYTCGDMLGGLWVLGYASGSAQMSAANFGRIAGRSAAKAALGE